MNKRFIFPLLWVMLLISPPILGQQRSPATPTKTVTTTVAPAQQKQPLFNKFKGTINRTTTTIKNLWTKTKGRISKVQPGTIQPKGDLTEFCKQFPDSPHCPHCGDGAVNQASEECDNGTANADTVADACRTDCKNPYCGDGVVDPAFGEECDGGSYCTPICHPVPPPPGTCQCKGGDKDCLNDPPPPDPHYTPCSTTAPWTKIIGTPGTNEYAAGLAVDSNGTIYTATAEGCTPGPCAPQFVVRQYDSCGNLVWEDSISGGQIFDSVDHLAIDRCGNSYIITTVFPSSISEVPIRKYPFTGPPASWTDIPSTPPASGGSAIAATQEGEVYAVGRYWESIAGVDSRNSWIRKYSTDGTLLWTQEDDLGGDYTHIPRGADVDSAGNLYLSIYASGSSGSPTRIVKHAPSGGAPLWSYEVGPSIGSCIYPRGIADPGGIVVGSSGLLYLANGLTSGSTTTPTPYEPPNGLYSLFSSDDGAFLSDQCTDLTDPNYPYSQGIAIDSSGNVLTASALSSKEPPYMDVHVRVTKSDPTLGVATVWQDIIAGPEFLCSGGGGRKAAVATGPGGYVYLLGTITDTTGLSEVACGYPGPTTDVILRKYAPDGAGGGWPYP